VELQVPGKRAILCTFLPFLFEIRDQSFCWKKWSHCYNSSRVSDYGL